MTIPPTKATNWHSNNWLVFAIILISSLLIYHAVFTADYFFLDESFELWHRTSNRNYIVFASSGRLFTGIIFQKFISSIDTVAQLKILRATSLFGWVATSMLLYLFSKNWITKLGLDIRLPFVMGFLCICSTAATINIGWASCFTFFLGFIVALFAAQILFNELTKEGKEKKPRLLALLSVLALGVTSLLIYQNMFGVFLLPFILWWISPYQNNKKNRIFFAIAIYVMVYVVYFLVFKYYVRLLQIPVTDRAELIFNPVQKTAFFFSTPFSQAWSLNHLVNAHNLISQVFPLVVFIIWVVLYHKQTGNKIVSTFLGLMVILAFLFLSYLPSIAASLNYSPYRTMAALSICAGTLFASSVLTSLKSENQKLIFIAGLLAFSLFFGYTNFNTRFVTPQREEFRKAIAQPFWDSYNGEDTVIFIRPSASLFKELYGITSYKDEFGVPGTFRDWVPDYWTRQLIYERTSMEKANKAVILQFRDEQHFRDSLGNSIRQPLIIDMNKIIKGN